MSLTEALEREVDTRGWSHRQAGEEIGVAQQTFTRWVNGQAIPENEYLPALAKFLDLDAAPTAELVLAARRDARARRRAPDAADRLAGIEERVAKLEQAIVSLSAELLELLRELREPPPPQPSAGSS